MNTVDDPGPADAPGPAAPDAQAWLARNDDYLGAALAALRARFDALTRRAPVIATASPPPQAPTPSFAAPSTVAVDPPSTRPQRGFGGLFRRATPIVPSVTTDALRLAAAPPAFTAASTTAATAAAIDRADDDVAQRLAAASTGDPPPALLMLARRLGLSDFERDILLLCIALELDTGTPERCAAAQGQAGRDYPTFALAMALFDAPAWEALSPERPLRHWRLIEINQPSTRALTASALRADERIVNFVKGLNDIDDRVAPLLLPMPVPTAAQLPPSHRVAVDALRQALDAPAAADRAHAAIVLRGADRASKRDVAGALAATLSMRLCRLPADALPAQPAELEMLARLWHRESLLLPLALYIDAHEADRSQGPDGLAQRIGRFVARTGGLIFIDTRDGVDLPVETLAAIDVAKPTPAEQRDAWRAAIGDATGPLAGLLATQFDLSRNDIDAIAERVRGRAPVAAAGADGDAARGDDGPPDRVADAYWRACRERTRPSLARLAERIDALATWDQLVLPAPETALLRQIAAQVGQRARVYDEWGFRARMNRGLGVSALFAGDSGTGKTMAAEVLANALRLDLYRIDLSAVVSKYIGETEKNLRDVFDAAESGGAILLFDEADALFGKRSEVKDSHDRYANIEVDYLLQRVEAFGGLAILATNTKSALDTAFVRRLRFIVDFPYPAAAERRRMWERVFPPEAEVGVIDHERLARLNLTGGNIQSTALTAAFMAAEAGTPVTMNLLLEAGRMEYRKLDRPVNEADFRVVGGGARS